MKNMKELEDKMLSHYMLGFNDELSGKEEPLIDDLLLHCAYSLGRQDAIVGDDTRCVDYKSDADIINDIRISFLTKCMLVSGFK